MSLVKLPPPRKSAKVTAPSKSAPAPSKSPIVAAGPSKPKKIAFFNHKGGVSKTTTVFNLGWKLAEQGHRVVLVDTDPQCNLSGLILGYRGENDFEAFYEKEPERNIRAGVAAAFESRPKLIEAIECVPVAGVGNLWLLPGHIRLAEYEVTLGLAQELTSTIPTLQNLPGAISYLLDKTAERHLADVLLIDMSPSLSSLNKNILMTSDYFVVPTSPDYFSVMAIESLATVLPKWRAWSKQAAGSDAFADSSYPFPTTVPRLLGAIVQKYRVRDRDTAKLGDNDGPPSSGSPAEGFKKWIDEISRVNATKLIPVLDGCGMLLPPEKYAAEHIGEGKLIAEISEFNSLIAMAQKSQVPVFALTDAQIDQRGVVLEATNRSKGMFNRIFERLATIVNNLIA